MPATMQDINALRQERAELVARARAILDDAQERAEGQRDLTSDEEQEFDRLMEEADRIERRVTREERARAADRGEADDEPDPPDDPNPDDPGGGRAQDQDGMRAWNRFLRDGLPALTEAEQRSLVMGSDPEGGYLVAPQQFVAQLIQDLDDAVVIRGLATTMQLTEGESLGVPSLDSDLNDAEWTAELQTGSEDDSLRFGRREFRPHPLAKRTKISRTLLRRATLDPEAIVRARLGYKFSVTQEKGFMTGDGNQKPLGLFVASNDGIPTGRDVNSGNATDVTGDGLIDAKYTLKAPYWRRARWLLHRDVIRNIRKLTDSNGQYVWQPGLAGDRPDTILEVPFISSEFAPNTFSEDEYIGMIGDFSFYWIADALDMEVQRLIELYAETNQVGFIGRMETDGMPVKSEAFARVKLKA